MHTFKMQFFGKLTLLLLVLVALGPLALANRQAIDFPALTEKLHYTVSYQGFLTLGLSVDIASANLQLYAGKVQIDGKPHRRAHLQVTTAPFPRMEAFYPLRFDYQSWLDPKLDYVSLISMRKRSSSLRHDLVWFDHRERMVRTFRKGTQELSSARSRPPLSLVAQVDINDPARFSERRAIEMDSGSVLDRLGMLYQLRGRSLQPGDRIELPVSNGKDLQAYLINVEARELVEDGSGALVDALRLRLTPKFNEGGSRGYSVRVWLSDDDKRVPLRFRSSKFGGAIELRLSPAG